MLYRHYSNRLETLAEGLAELLAEPLPDPLAPETVIVQSNGMARWLSLRLAERLGVCSNVRFPFPASFLWQQLRQTLAAVPETASFDKPVLTWRVLGLLQGLDDDPVLDPLRAYLGAGDDEFRAYDLARRIADIYDQYLVYRPGWIEAWERGDDLPWLQPGELWQPALWRRLSQAAGDHRGRLLTRFAGRLADGVAPPGLPPRIALIGLSALPPQQLELLALLAGHCDVHLLLLNPCAVYWGDIQAARDIARRDPLTDPASDYLEVGNALLASLGKQGRDFFDLLENEQYPSISNELFVEPDEAHLLGWLQADILHLRERGVSVTGNTPEPVLPLPAGDRSVQVHACHSATRELEVLHDRLLEQFQQDPELRPSDVVVMTPDIEAYGPLIDAVFGSVERHRYIPYSIADRGPGAERPLLEAVQQLFELARGRYPVDQVLGFLERPAVRRRFGLEAADLSLIQRWLDTANVRWAVDAADRVALDLPGTSEHTWRAGLERLLLGYALPGDGVQLWDDDILPLGLAEGGNGQILGHLQCYAEALFQLREDITEPRPLAQWVALIDGWLDRFFAPAELEADELQALRAALLQLANNAAQADYQAPLPLTVVRAALNRALADQTGATGFFAGGVTFATMVPMRSIPFQVVALIGMNQDSYPRPHRPVDFDLMAQRYRKGDRSRRQDDRYLFLEALLSARRCFYLSYLGRDIRDNTELPPSVLVSELLEVIEQGFRMAAGGNPRSQIVTGHPLQSFSRRYFDGSDPGLFSYSTEGLALGRRATGERRTGIPFVTAALPPPGAEWQLLTPRQLVRFFEHPARFLVSERLGLQLEVETLELESREPFVLDGLGRYGLYQRLLELILDGIDRDHAYTLVRTGGLLPHGQVGANIFAHEWTRIIRFAARVRRALQPLPHDPVELDYPHDGLRLRGWLDRLTASGLIDYRPAKIKPKDRLRLWLRHLLLNLGRPAGVEPSSRFLGLDGELALAPVADPAAQIAPLLALYQRGLSEPLPLLPATSWAYAAALQEGKDTGDALNDARKCWLGDGHHEGEYQRDPYLSLIWRGRDDIFDETFQDLACQVWQPQFAHAAGETP